MCLPKIKMKSAYEEIRDYSLNLRDFFDFNDIQQALPHLTEKTIIRTLLTYPEFVRYYKREFYNAAIIKLSQEEKESIFCDIEKEVKVSGYISSFDLAEIIKAKYPKVIENNSAAGVWRTIAALEYYSDGKYCFDRSMIFPADHVITPYEITEKLLKGKKRFMVEEAPENMQNLLNSWDEYVLFASGLEIDKDVYASKEFADFDVEKIDAAIEALCGKKVFPLPDIDVSSLPQSGFKWNQWLLRSYLFHYSKKYAVFFEHYPKPTVLTGIVTLADTGANSFVEALALAFTEEEKDLKLNEKNLVSPLEWSDFGNYIKKRGYVSFASTGYSAKLRQLADKHLQMRRIVNGKTKRSSYNG